MKRFKLWLLRWLGAMSEHEFYAMREADNQRIRDGCTAALSNLKADYEAAISELIQELNTVRNSIPAALTQAPGSGVRVFRNFREFRTMVESKQPIRIERTS